MSFGKCIVSRHCLETLSLVNAACAALTEEGEIFFYFNRTLFQDFMVLKQCPSVSALFQDIVLKQCPW